MSKAVPSRRLHRALDLRAFESDVQAAPRLRRIHLRRRVR